MKHFLIILLLFISSSIYSQTAPYGPVQRNNPSTATPSRPGQNVIAEKLITKKFEISKGLFYGKAMEIRGDKLHSYLIPSSRAVWDFLQQNPGLSGAGDDYEIATWLNDTLVGDPDFRIKGDTMYGHQATFVAGTSPISDLQIRFANAIPGMDPTNSLFDPTSPLNAMHWQEEGDGDWVTNVSTSYGGLILSEVDGGLGAQPRLQFHSARTNASLDPQTPVAGDYFFRIRALKHKGLNTSYPIYNYAAGGYFVSGQVDTVYGNGNLGGRLIFSTFDNQSNQFGGTERMRIGRTGNIKYSAYTSARNDTGVPTNILSVSSAGDMETHPITDLFLTASTTLDFGSTAANSSSTLTIAVTGAADGDPVHLGVANAATTGGGAFFAWVSATNTVSVRFINNTGSPIDPASATFKVKVSKF